MLENDIAYGKKIILVVDDIEMNCSIVKKIFENTHIVLSAENGKAAMQILHKQDVDIVLLDIQMPVMNGYEVIQAMKKSRRLAEIPILVTTGAIDKSERKAFELGADDYLTQPYDPFIMRKRVENLIDRYNLRVMRHALNEKEKARNLLDVLGIAYWEWTRMGGYYHSEQYEKYAISEMQEEKIWDNETPFQYVHPDDVALMKKYMEQYPENEKKKTAVLRCKMRDGSYHWTEMFSSSEKGADGKLERLVSAMRDVDKEWISAFTVEQKNRELSHIIDSTSGGVINYKLGKKLELTSYSKRIADKLGYSEEEMKTAGSYDAYDFIYPNDLDLVKEKMEQVISNLIPVTLAYRIRKKDYTYKWFRASFYPADEADGCPQIYAVLTDIGEVNAEYEDALNQTNEMVVVADWESREILYLNEAAAKVRGRTAADLFGKKCSQIVQRCDQCCPYCFKDDLSYDELLVREMSVHGKFFQTKGKRMKWNGRDAFVEYVSDVTAQHNMTEQVVFERNLLTSATKVLFPMCIISNLTQNTYKIVEYEKFSTKKAAIDGIYDDLIAVGASTIPEQDRKAFITAFSRENLLKAYAEGRKIIPLIHQQIGDDGNLHWNRTTLVFADQLLNGDLYSISFTDNVDEQKKNEVSLQMALETAEKANAAKTAFLSRVSHDMRTPLNGILGLTTILKDNITDNTIARELKELELSGRYLLNLINDTLDVSRIENGKMELHPAVCNGKNLFSNVLSLVKTNAKAKNIELHISAESIPCTMLYVDIGRLEQIFMNVIGNAIKFTPENGRIDINVTSLSVESDVIIEKIEIRDYGIGMSSEFLPHIFEAFSQEDTSRTSSNQGTGLGMAITKQIVSLMGGEILVESELGAGTCFTIIVKLQIASDEQIKVWEKSRISISREEGLSGKRVLLCEDHPLNTKIAIKLLEAKGMLVEHAENGQIGVELFQQSDEGFYDVVLMDIRMPVMDGLDAARAIRTLSRKDAQTIPIVAMTANAFAEDMKQTKEAGMNVHLSKPIQTELLYSTLSDLLK